MNFFESFDSLPVKSEVDPTTKEARGGPKKTRGGARASAGKHVFFLIFFGSFLDQAKKEQNGAGHWEFSDKTNARPSGND